MAKSTPRNKEAVEPEPHRRLAGTIAILERWHGADDPRLPELRRDLRAMRLAEHIRQVVEAAPPLTADQIARLRDLLPPVDAPTAEQGGGEAA